MLLNLMAAMTAFKANRRQTKAAVDERLMEGSPGEEFSES
jgi:hypothetical protein